MSRPSACRGERIGRRGQVHQKQPGAVAVAEQVGGVLGAVGGGVAVARRDGVRTRSIAASASATPSAAVRGGRSEALGGVRPNGSFRPSNIGRDL
jgi:hypothetical protein